MFEHNKVTIQEIADAADVSIATVSRILNNKGTVKQETRKKVLEAMETLNFHPGTDSKLINVKSNTLLLCVPDFTNPFNAPIIDGVQSSAHQHGYHVLLLQSKNFYNNFSDYEEILKNQSIAGVILLTPSPGINLVESMNFRCPVVMCSEHSDDVNISFVSIDDVAAAKNATEYLISTGRRKIAMINSSLQNKYARNREQGYRLALKEAGIPINTAWISHLSAVTYTLAYSFATHILNMPDRPDAFFSAADVYAVGILRAARKLGLKVPQDVSIVGFDNIELSAMTDPPLTTVEQPAYQIGYQSCELLIEKINNLQVEAKQIILETELIVRGSTSFAL